MDNGTEIPERRWCMQAAAVQQQLQQVASTTEGQGLLLNELRKNGVGVSAVQVNQINGQAVTQPPRAVRPAAPPSPTGIHARCARDDALRGDKREAGKTGGRVRMGGAVPRVALGG